LRRILAATDFSARSDRAIRRAVLLANQFSAAITVLHVVNDDQAELLVQAESAATRQLLDALCRSLQDRDGVTCMTEVRSASAFQGILDAARDHAADLVVLGEHRRQVLRDLFIGTTAERVIDFGESPVIMVSAVPAAFYRSVLVAVDLSDHSAHALKTFFELGLGQQAHVTAMHAFETAGDTLIAASTMSDPERAAYLEQASADAAERLSNFLQDLSAKPDSICLKHGPAAAKIRECAREMGADLIVLGTKAYSGLKSVVWGSVSEEVLRMADRDVLTIPGRKMD